MDDLFAPPAYAWQRLSPRYVSLRRVTTLLVAPIVFTVPALVVGLAFDLWWLAGILWGLAALIVVVRWFLIGRTTAPGATSSARTTSTSPTGCCSARSWPSRTAHAARRGRLGPLERSFRLATVTLKTASAETDATIPGLDPEEAARLRDRLTELGEAQASGL